MQNAAEAGYQKGVVRCRQNETEGVDKPYAELFAIIDDSSEINVKYNTIQFNTLDLIFFHFTLLYFI